MTKILSIVCPSFVALFASISIAQVTPMEWTSTSGGNIGSVSVTVSGLSSDFLAVQTGRNLSLPDFDPPLSNVDSVEYGASNNWEASFSPTVSSLLIYAEFWRGATNTSDDPPVHYVFDHPFTILSGLDGASVSGTTLVLDDDFADFYQGVIHFSGPLDSISVVSDAPNESGQLMTFGLAVPEPAGAVLIAMACVLLLCQRRRMSS